MYVSRSVVATIGLAALFVVCVAAVPNTSYRYERPLGQQVLTNPNNSTLTVPAGTRHLRFSVRGGGVMLTEDGTTATSTTGFYIPAGVIWISDNDPGLPSVMRFACSSDNSGACQVYALYSGDQP